MNFSLNLNEDEKIFSSGKKNLAQLFDVDIKQGKGDDESLRYTPPKAAKQKPKLKTTMTRTGATGSSDTWLTQLAKVVVGFRNGEKIGRVGVAILYNNDYVYSIVVYRSKEDLLARLIFDAEVTSPQLQRNNCYWQFYDDVGVHWSLLFERSTDEYEFIEKLQEFGIQMLLEGNEATEKLINSLRHVKTCISDVLNPSAVTEKFVDKDLEHNLDSPQDTKADNLALTENTEQTESNSVQHTKLLARLTKMGGQRLPKLSNKSKLTTNSDSSDAEVFESGSSSTIVGPKELPHKACTQFRLPIAPASTALVTSTTSSNVLSQIESQVMQMLLVENRTQNSELRANMSKFEEKLEKVLDRIDSMHIGAANEDDIFKLEEKVVELKRENRRLKQERKNYVGKKSESTDIWNIYDAELTKLQLDKNADTVLDTETLIGELIQKAFKLTSELDETRKQLTTALASIDEQKEHILREKRAHDETDAKLEKAEKSIATLQTTLDNKSESEKLLQQDMNDLLAEQTAQINTIKLEMTQSVKDIMNMLYHNIAENVINMDNFNHERVLAMIGQTIKNDTLGAIARIKK